MVYYNSSSHRFHDSISGRFVKRKRGYKPYKFFKKPAVKKKPVMEIKEIYKEFDYLEDYLNEGIKDSP